MQMTARNKRHLENKTLHFWTCAKFLTKPIRKPIDHPVVVTLHIPRHLFWFHADKQNILLPVCAPLSPRVHMIFDKAEVGGAFGDVGGLGDRLREMGRPTVSIQ